AAALLGALAADEGRVRARRRADAPGRARRGRDAPPDPPVLGAAVRGDAAAVLRGRVRRDLPGRLAGARARLHGRCREPVPARRSPQRAAPVPLLADLPRAAVLRDGRGRPPVGSAAHDDPPPRAQEHPHRPDRGRDLHVHVRDHVRDRGRVRLVTPLEPETPPAGEEIHLPGPSILPVLTALGITLLLIGLTTFIELTVIG